MSEDKKVALKEHLNQARAQLLAIVEQIQARDLWDVPVQAEGERWTALQMLRHLQDAQLGLTGQLKRLVMGEQTVPQDFDINRWNARQQRKMEDASLTPDQALESLAVGQQALFEFIDSIQDEDWAREGWQAGLQQMLPLERLIYVVGEHEAQHAAEMANALESAD